MKNSVVEPSPQLEPAEQAKPANSEPLSIPQLERELRLIQRYAFVHSNAPFQSDVPLIGPFIVAAKHAARRLLRGLLSTTVGTQDEFNAAVANILFEFTRRAATPEPLTLNDDTLDEVMRRLSTTSDGRGQAEVLRLLVREIQLLREQVRAAQLSASENERQVSELVRRVSILESQKDADKRG